MCRSVAVFAIPFFLFVAGWSDRLSAEMRTYGIGNSLTNDLYFGYVGKGLDKITSTTSNPIAMGVHLDCSQTLTNIWANPNGVDPVNGPCLVRPFGLYRDVLAAPVDNVFLQPHPGATIVQEVQAIKNFIDYTKQNPANADTRFFVYAPWGGRDDTGIGLSFFDTWLSHQATLNGGFIQSKSSYDLILSELETAGYDVEVIPAGEVFYSVMQSIRSGTQIEINSRTPSGQTVVNLTDTGLWRDVIHASETGSFVAGLTAYAAIYGVKASGINPLDYSLQEFPSQTFSEFLTPTGATVVENLVWDAYVQIAALPEPGAFSLALVACLAGVTGRRQRRVKHCCSTAKLAELDR